MQKKNVHRPRKHTVLHQMIWDHSLLACKEMVQGNEAEAALQAASRYALGSTVIDTGVFCDGVGLKEAGLVQHRRQQKSQF